MYFVYWVVVDKDGKRSAGLGKFGTMTKAVEEQDEIHDDHKDYKSVYTQIIEGQIVDYKDTENN